MYRGVEGPALDNILYTNIGVNELTTPAAENVASVESVKSTLTCVEYTPEEVEETSLLPGALPSIW